MYSTCLMLADKLLPNFAFLTAPKQARQYSKQYKAVALIRLSHIWDRQTDVSTLGFQQLKTARQDPRQTKAPLVDLFVARVFPNTQSPSHFPSLKLPSQLMLHAIFYYYLMGVGEIS